MYDLPLHNPGDAVAAGAELNEFALRSLFGARADAARAGCCRRTRAGGGRRAGADCTVTDILLEALAMHALQHVVEPLPATGARIRIVDPADDGASGN